MGPSCALPVKMKVRGCNFLASNLFLPIFNVTDALRGGLHLPFGQHKQWGPLAKTISNPTLNVRTMACSPYS